VGAAGLAIGIGSCSEDAAGPGISRTGYIALLPSFASTHASIITLQSARLTLQRPGETELLIDTIVGISASDTAVDLSLTVPVLSTEEIFVLNIQLIDPASDTVFRAGPIDVKPSLAGGTIEPIPVELTYVGIGSDAAGVRILADTTRLFVGDTVLIVAEAYDSAGDAIPGTPIAWASADTSVARIPVEDVGRVAGHGRGTTQVIATLLTDQADSTAVAVQPPPTSISIVSGGNQTNEVEQPLADSVVVRALASDGLGVSGITLVITTADGGTLAPDTLVTDATGRAAFAWTLGSTPGTQTASIAIVEFSAVTQTVTATASRKPATDLTIVTGDGQTGVVNQPLPVLLEVLATDIDGNAVPDAQVSWTVTLNDGSVTPGVSATDANGIATTVWTLGTLAGANEVEAALIGAAPAPPADSAGSGGPQPGAAASSVVFTATGTAGAPAILVPVSGDLQGDTTNATLPQPIVVEVTDLFGNAVEGTTVDFAVVRGSVSPTSAATDASGLVQTTWTVGAVAGTDTLTVSSGALTPLIFTATVTFPPHVNTWTGTAGDGLWTTAGNWSRNEAPTPIDTVVIGLAETVVLNTAASVERTEIVDPGAVLRLISSDQANPAELTVTGDLTNAGTVEMADGTSGASAGLTVSDPHRHSGRRQPGIDHLDLPTDHHQHRHHVHHRKRITVGRQRRADRQRRDRRRRDRHRPWRRR
jgi:hypothetical protein